jgi:undecaprenyl pyrophosphate phosphatase UppP
MSSTTRPADRPLARAGAVARVLDPAVGLFVWALHLLVVYIAAAVACVLGLADASASARTLFPWALVALTLLAEAAALVHGARRYAQTRSLPDQRFRLALTVGLDAIAALAIVWQLFPILLAPLCR